jgi:hypothetical protein
LHVAVTNEQLSVVQKLLDLGANPWLKDPKQMKHTPSWPWLTSSPRATLSFISARQQASYCKVVSPLREVPRLTATHCLPR